MNMEFVGLKNVLEVYDELSYYLATINIKDEFTLEKKFTEIEGKEILFCGWNLCCNGVVLATTENRRQCSKLFSCLSKHLIEGGFTRYQIIEPDCDEEADESDCPDHIEETLEDVVYRLTEM